MKVWIPIFAGLGLLLHATGWAGDTVAAPKAPIAPTVAELQAELQAIRKLPTSLQRSLDESKLLFHLGKTLESSGKNDLAMSTYEEGKKLAGSLRIAYPQSAWAHLWWVGHSGKIAAMERNLSALFLLPDLEKALFKAKELDPTLDEGLPDRALGRLYQMAPSIISIGSSSKARKHLLAALERSPTHPCVQAYLAEMYLNDGDAESLKQARKYADLVLSNPRLKEFRYEALDWYEMATDVKKELKSE